jgi:preprotein translocase subunit SecD
MASSRLLLLILLLTSCSSGSEVPSVSSDAPKWRALQFHLAEMEARDDLLPMRVEGRTGFIYLHPDVILDDRDIERATAVQGQLGEPTVQAKLTPEGYRKMKKVMRENQKKTIAIVVRGTVISTPVIFGELADELLDIEGSFTRTETEELAKALNSKD